MAAPPTIPVGLDISSLYCRVAIDGRGVVSNTQGARFTLGLVAREEGEEEGAPAPSFVFGDAAQRSSSHSTLPRAVADDKEAAQAFLAYVIQLAADNAAVSVDLLRLVVTLPSGVEGEGQQAWLECITAACKSLIPDKKKRKKDFCMAVVTKAAATCVAYGVASKKKTLVVNMDGDAALQWTVLEYVGGVYSITNDSMTLADLTGPIVVKLLADFCATQFERQAKIPRGEVMQHKKARTKLLVEAERQLLSGKTTMSFLMDGLFEGIDCNVTVSKPRWDMISGKILRQAESSIQPLTEAGVQSVLLSGAWATSLLKPSLVKLFGDSLVVANSNLAPEEAVVLGCAKQAGYMQRKSDKLQPVTSPAVSVPVSPVAIGFGEDDVLIAEGTPLPAATTHTFSAGSSCCKLYQLTPTRIELADLKDIHDGEALAIELTAHGQITIGLVGGAPLVTI